MPDSSFDLIIIGGGPAGYPCAIRASQLGLRSAWSSLTRLGGRMRQHRLHPHQGAALQCVDREHDSQPGEGTRHRDRRGQGRLWRCDEAFTEVADQNSKGVEFLMKKHKVTVIAGTGVLTSADHRAGRQRHAHREEGDRARDRFAGEGHPSGRARRSTRRRSSLRMRPCSSRGAQDAGGRGCGRGRAPSSPTSSSSFGRKVTLIEALPRILPIEDAESSDVIAKSFKKRGIKCLPA